MKRLNAKTYDMNSGNKKNIHDKIYLLLYLAIIITMLTPQAYAATYSTMTTIPSTCTGGSITSDTVNGGGGRVISCSGNTGNLTVVTYNKPGDTSPQYFEMNKQNSTGSGVQICLLGTCISSNGYAKSPNFPISDGANNVTTGTISLTTTPGSANVMLNANNAGTTSAGASGTLTLQNVPSGSNTVAVSLSGYQSSSNSVSVTAGQTTNLNVVLQQNQQQQNGTVYTTMNNIPSTCTGGNILSDTVNGGGGRIIICNGNTGNLTVSAYNKPGNTNPQYFEMYKQFSTGGGVKVCLLDTCISNNGYVKSQNFPIIGPTGNNTGNNTQNNTGNNTGNQTNNTAYYNVQFIPATCNGGSITSDTFFSGRDITCTNGPNSLEIGAWDKPTIETATHFEMSKLAQSGSGLQICLLSTCISDNGYISSPNYPIFGSGGSSNQTNNTGSSTGTIILTTQPGGAVITLNGNNVGTTDTVTGVLNILNAPTGNDAIVASKTNYANAQVTVSVTSGQTTSQFLRLLNTNPANQPPQAPIFNEPAATGVYPNDFHLHVNNAIDAENDAIIYSDYEIWDIPANQLVWASYKETVDPYHIHRMDGTFMGNLGGQTQLKFNTTYEVRARFYEYATFNNVSAWSAWRVFQTIPPINITTTVAGWTPAPGYAIQKVASNVNLPVNVIMAPNLYGNVAQGKRPLLYVTQLYGQIGVLLNDGTYQQYAGNLLGTPPPGGIPGGGEAGVDGLYVDSVTGDVYVSMSYTDNTSITGMSAKIVHFTTNSTGNGYTSSNIIKDKIPVRPSHEAHTILKGPDGKMYLSIGDASQNSWPQDPTKLAGKVLRMNWDGSMPSDNPFNGTYTYALGFRNPFGMAFRPGTNELYVSNNGQDTDDGLYKTFAGSQFGWPNSLTQGVWYGWPVEIAPTQVAFDANNAFPNDANNVYIVGSGSTYLQGPSPNSKRIFQIPINPNGSHGTATPIATYTGAGYGDPIGLTFASDGAYFTDIYGDAGFTGAGVTKGNIYKIIWTGQNATINQSNSTSNTTFSTVIAQHPWYPQGLNMIWDCKPTGGSGNFKYDFTFGDGNQQLNVNVNNVYHTYASHGSYNAGCTVHDLSNGQQTSASTTLNI